MMALTEFGFAAAERVAWPDFVTMAGIDWLVGRTKRQLIAAGPDASAALARDMAQFPIAVHAADANRQHYEVPADFFALVLGPQRKYSCCLYGPKTRNLAEAEEHALAETAAHAALADGHEILELGCGWGSLSLWMARHFPQARITAVSNSHSQRAYILAEATRLCLQNLDVVTTDMNDFVAPQTYDRVVSVEMFEHMSNWRDLLRRVRHWLKPDGRLFLHVFTHRTAPYRFNTDDKSDWIAQHFFTGGIMPSHSLIREFSDLFTLDDEWRWSGAHYQRTAQDWLANFDRNKAAIVDILRPVYGAETSLWLRRWRLFFLATAGLFGHAGGTEWGVSHYRLVPAAVSG